MIKTLKRRFVAASMAAVTILLVVMLGTLNIANGVYSQQKMVKIAKDLLQSTSGGIYTWSDFSLEKWDSHVFILAELYEDGRIGVLDTDPVTFYDRDEAKYYAHRAFVAEKSQGLIDQFFYVRGNFSTQEEISLVLLDTTVQKQQWLQVVGLSSACGVLVWFVMLAIVLALCGQAIAPIAQNIEKQKRFVTDAGHETKTPLAIITANLDAMELHMGENKWTQNIRTQAVRLTGLMQNLLTLSKAGETVQPDKTELCNLSAITQEMADGFWESAMLADQDYQVDIAPDLTVRGVKDMLQRLVSILLDNAIKYTPQGGAIRLQLSQEEKKTVLRVRNNCVMEADFQPDRLFDRFYRADTARTQQGKGGYGIGLSAAQAIAQMHKGTIEAKRLNEDTLEFIVKL